METLFFEYPAKNKLLQEAHVGVVGSGDLEVLIIPSNEPKSRVEVRTGMKGFNDTWERVIKRFSENHSIKATIKVNDFGATPGVASLRLAQALEVSTHVKSH